MLHAEQGGFRIGEVAQARPRRPLEIFGCPSVDVTAGETANWSVGVDQHQAPSTRRQMSSERLGELDIVVEAAAVYQLHARHQALENARREHERMGAVGRR